MSTVVDGPAAGDIASRVTGGEVVPLASRATWLATGSGGAGTVTILALQFGTAGVVSAGLVGVGDAVSVAVRRGRAGRGTGTGGGVLARMVCWELLGGARPAAGGLLGGPRRWSWPGNQRLPQRGTTHQSPPERIQHTRLTESPRAVLAGDRDSTDTTCLRPPQSRDRSGHRHAHLRTRQPDAPVPHHHPHVER